MIAYLDCVCGISGDMFLSSLIDAGFPVSALKDVISRLNIGLADIKVLKEARHGIHGTRIEVHPLNQEKSRSFRSIRNLIQESGLESEVKRRCIDIFEMIAKAEAKIHNCSVDEVHFHEIAGLDSIVDIVGVIAGLEYMGIISLTSSSLPLGSGSAETIHGVIPVPSPATVEILQGIPVYGSGISAELVTPTGAALVKGLVKGFGQFPPMVVKGVGYGIGARDLKERPNIVRLILGEPSEGEELDTVVMLETHVDDCNPEHLGYLMEMLFKNGAFDVAYAPIFMKKNRPGICIKVICGAGNMDSLMDIIFRETGSLGIRYSFNFRRRLEREIKEVLTPWGKIRVKEIYQADGSVYLKPEYDDCLKIAKKYDIPLRKVYGYVVGKKR